jgi:hypothetical protein
MCDRNTELSNCLELLPSDEDPELGEEDKELLDIYHHSFNDENIDMDLLMALLCDIHTSQDKGKSDRGDLTVIYLVCVIFILEQNGKSSLS